MEVAPSAPLWVHGSVGMSSPPWGAVADLYAHLSPLWVSGHGCQDGSVSAGVCHLEPEPAHLCEPLSFSGSLSRTPVLGRVCEGTSVFMYRNSYTSLDSSYKPPPPNYLMEASLPRSLPSSPPASRLIQVSGLPLLIPSLSCAP